MPRIPFIPEGHDGVDPVVAAVELDDHQDAAVLRGFERHSRYGARNAGSDRRQGDQRRIPQAVARGNLDAYSSFCPFE